MSQSAKAFTLKIQRPKVGSPFRPQGLHTDCCRRCRHSSHTVPGAQNRTNDTGRCAWEKSAMSY